jgi:hypothetical protein
MSAVGMIALFLGIVAILGIIEAVRYLCEDDD